jgi:hypothetical protein
MRVRIGFVLRVDPNEGAACDSFFAERRQLVERGGAVAGVCRKGQTSGQVRARRGADELAVQFGKPASVHTDLDETGANTCFFDSLAPVVEPPRGQLIGGLSERGTRCT